MNYYYTDGRERFGPFTFEELKARGITVDTLVWREGLTDWIPAGNLEEFKSFFYQDTIYNQSNSAIGFQPMPKSWLVEGILITIFCCLPLGIVSIILSIKMESFWKLGEFKAAQMLSDEAGRWIKIGLIVGIVVWFLMFLLGIATRNMTEMMNEQVI